MKKINLDTWIQLIGMLSVVAGLIFVGIEMRQTQQVALAAQQQQRASALLDIIGSFSETDSPISWLDFVSENFDVSDEKTKHWVKMLLTSYGWFMKMTIYNMS